MQHGVPLWHTAAEMQAFSNSMHTVEGALLVVFGILALLESERRRHSRYRLWWPSIAAAAGVTLVAVLLIPFHGVDTAAIQLRFVLADAQQLQHLLLGIALAAGGCAELTVRRLESQSLLQHVWPTALGFIGVLFIVHRQHGGHQAVAQAMMQHMAIGMLFVAAACTSGAGVRLERLRGALRVASAICLIASGLLLARYIEPDGAFTSDNATTHTMR
jgi:hypothetical protein